MPRSQAASLRAAGTAAAKIDDNRCRSPRIYARCSKISTFGSSAWHLAASQPSAGREVPSAREKNSFSPCQALEPKWPRLQRSRGAGGAHARNAMIFGLKSSLIVSSANFAKLAITSAIFGNLA